MSKDIIELNPQHPEGLTDAQEELAFSLHDSGVVRFNFVKGFKLTSGLISPVYMDLRRVQSFPDTMDLTVGALIEQTRGLEYDRIVGVPTAAIPMASVLANKLRKPQITPRMDLKDYGIAQRIDGEFFPGETALIIDDLVTTGGSKLGVIEILKEAGLIVRDIVVVVDRQQGAEQDLADKGLALHAALKIRPVLRLYGRVGRITQEEMTNVLDYLGGKPFMPKQ